MPVSQVVAVIALARLSGCRAKVLEVAGGTSLRPFKTPLKSNSERQNATAHGVLKLTLKSTGYDWQFVPVAGKTFTDSGSASCHW